MQTIIELPEYMRKIDKLLGKSDCNKIINYLAVNPKSGDIITGTGGIRKLRWARPGIGKRGGVRIIYYFHNEGIPLFLLTVFGKNERDNLTKAEGNELSKFVKSLIESYGG